MSEVNQQSNGVQPQKKKGGWYTAARILAAIMTHTVTPVTYHNTELLPQEGPCIMIANHSHWLDPFFVAAPVKKAEITFMGKKELARNKFTQYLFKKLHMIVVDRHNSDMEAMRACTRVLRNQEILGIFPEGTRHHKGTMEELESGVGLIALRANVPLVPMYITPFKLFHRTHCYVGKPIVFSDLRAEGVNNETCQLLLGRITDVYADMVKEASKK